VKRRRSCFQRFLWGGEIRYVGIQGGLLLRGILEKFTQAGLEKAVRGARTLGQALSKKGHQTKQAGALRVAGWSRQEGLNGRGRPF